MGRRVHALPEGGARPAGGAARLNITFKSNLHLSITGIVAAGTPRYVRESQTAQSKDTYA